ncbi:type I-G CRISPR-associated helicase/endonuclease Cas3g [Rhodoplanes serenus]|nr:type I-U CRISPR-associated helicase/endonuclease Cas3 [Rhodoplanes serenus]
MTDGLFFDSGFEALTGHSPMPWQRRLFAELHTGRIPDALDLPTGLGKTSVMAIWLLALAAQAAAGRPSLPRRLVYVVDRRTVVDQATDTAERMRKAVLSAAPDAATRLVRDALRSLCVAPDETPLAISTLRGEHADNREWQADPARPGIVVGTVDMIGSRLLFSGYGVSRGMRPFHAGLIGHDTLLVLDEAHLSPAFGALVGALATRQAEWREPRPLRLIELSATRRSAAGRVFRLTDEDRAEPEVRARTTAEKILTFESAIGDHRAALAAIVAHARRHHADRKRVVVYLRAPADVQLVAEMLGEDGNEVAILTGTIRGRERDALAESPLFEGFKSVEKRDPPPRTQYLVATSAGEVGIDLDADHMVCDLTTLDSMIQRLGRVNRRGRGAATVHVVEVPRKGKDDTEADARLAATRAALTSLPRRGDGYDASPDALRALADRTDAFAAVPRTVPVTDILLDAWALTRVRDLPGRPPVARWLHGIEAEQPALHVAWREEVSLLGDAAPRAVRALYEKHPILARERLQGPLRAVLGELSKIAKRAGNPQEEDRVPLTAVLIPASGDPIHGYLTDLLDDESPLAEGTLVLPPAAGGLDRLGMLDGAAKMSPAVAYDVADEEPASADSGRDPAPRRTRLRLIVRLDDEQGGWSVRSLGVAGVVLADGIEALSWRDALDEVPGIAHLAQKDALVLSRDGEGEPTTVLVLRGASRSLEVAQDDPAAAAGERTLDDHAADVSAVAEAIVARLGPLIHGDLDSQAIAEAIVLAARHHDLGKNRPAWQADIGNSLRGGRTPWVPLAKSGRRGFASRRSGAYRHEFGSLREAAGIAAIASHPERDLILHLIAAHHGWARPHFNPDQWDIADGVDEEENAAVAAEAMRRSARLQRRFGYWGLAWLESLMRAADYAASRAVPGDVAGASGTMAEESVA